MPLRLVSTSVYDAQNSASADLTGEGSLPVSQISILGASGKPKSPSVGRTDQGQIAVGERHVSRGARIQAKIAVGGARGSKPKSPSVGRADNRCGSGGGHVVVAIVGVEAGVDIEEGKHEVKVAREHEIGGVGGGVGEEEGVVDEMQEAVATREEELGWEVFRVSSSPT